MAVTYSTAALDARLNAVVSIIGAGSIVLLASGTVIATMPLNTPCGTVSGGVLSFTQPTTDGSASGTGTVDAAQVRDASGTVVISGLTVGIPLAPAEVTISNGLNSTYLTAGQTVQLVAGQITGG